MKEERLGDRDGDHREVDAGAPQRDEPHQIADRRGGDHADDKAENDVMETGYGQQIGGDESAGADKMPIGRTRAVR